MKKNQITEQFRLFRTFEESKGRLFSSSADGNMKNKEVDEDFRVIYDQFVEDLNNTSYDRLKDKIGQDWPSHVLNCFKRELTKNIRVS